MNSRLRDLLRRWAARVGLVVLLCGIPVALVTAFRWPLPDRPPTMDAFERALTEGPAVNPLEVLGVILWLVWIPLALATMRELIGALRGGPELPRTRLMGPIQPLIARLVAAAVLANAPVASGVLTRPALAVAGGFEMAVVDTSVTTAGTGLSRPRPPKLPEHPPDRPSPSSVPDTPSDEPDRRPAVQGARKQYLVHRGDTLIWMARTFLGDEERFMEIFEMNSGKRMSNGRPFRNPDDIVTGTVLDMPMDAVGLPELPEHLQGDDPDCHPMAPASGQTPPETHPAAPAGPAAESSHDDRPPPTSPAPPAPPSEDRGDVVSTVTALPSPHGEPLPVPRSTSPLIDRPGPGAGGAPTGEGDFTPLAAAFLAGGLMGAGVIRLLDRLRTVQRRHRRPGRRIRLPEPEVARSEVALRAGAAYDEAAIVSRGGALLAARLREVEAVPEVIAAEVRGDDIEFLLGSAESRAPDGFVATAGGRRWRLAETVDESVLGPAPLPLLVSVGTTDEGGFLLVDLEQAGVTSLEGDEDAVHKALLASALELASNESAEACRVIVLGLDQRLDFVERVHRVASFEELVEELRPQGADLGRLLDESGWSSMFEARVREPDGDWTPTVAVCAEPVPPALAPRLVEVVMGANQAGVAVLAIGPIPGAQVRIELSRGSALVRPYGISLHREELTDDDVETLFTLWAVARDRRDVPPSESGSSVDRVIGGDHEILTAASGAEGEDSSGGRGTTGGRDENSVEAQVMVRVLGPVDVVGSATSLERRKSLELVAYLVMHRDGVGGDRLTEKLWPRRQSSPSTFNTTVSVARGCLGTSSDGSLHLPHVGGGLYRLAPSVTSDLQRFRSLVTRGRAAPARDETISCLRAALEFVRGRPFDTDGRDYNWVHEEGYASNIPAEIADVAHEVAGYCLEDGDAAGARWAARQGLLASEGDEQLYRDLMRAEDLDGNRAGIQSIMDELATVAEELEPYDGLHPETLALYRELTVKAPVSPASLRTDGASPTSAWTSLLREPDSEPDHPAAVE